MYNNKYDRIIYMILYITYDFEFLLRIGKLSYGCRNKKLKKICPMIRVPLLFYIYALRSYTEYENIKYFFIRITNPHPHFKHFSFILLCISCPITWHIILHHRTLRF